MKLSADSQMMGDVGGLFRELHRATIEDQCRDEGWTVEDVEKTALQELEESGSVLVIVNKQIVLDLMKFAKPDPPNARVQSVQQVLRNALQHWKQALPSPGGQINTGHLQQDLNVYADADQLQEIVTAVIDNAIQACSFHADRVQINSPLQASDETVRIVVRDNGPGMSPEVLEHAFDPFFSHRPAGRGRGMGLTRAYRLAEINGGRLWIDSKPGEGTMVTIELPSRPPTA